MPNALDLAVSSPVIDLDLTVSPPAVLPYNYRPPSPPPSPETRSSHHNNDNTPSHAQSSCDHSADVRWLLHVKSAPRARPQPSAVTSLLPRSLTTTFFAAPSMTPADLAALSGDMALARSIHFLPYRSPDDCLAATYAFSRRRQQQMQLHVQSQMLPPPPPLRSSVRKRPYTNNLPTNATTNASAWKHNHGYNYGYDGYNNGYTYHVPRQDEIRAPLIPEEWYPGFWYYVKLRGDWIARHPSVRSVSGRNQFLSRREDAEEYW
ncbi:hypothetical protein ABW21_db0202324 [Orbilia brochopaga]|nr:hypothetical protein ABW21_db0202324 [Drechslerella brochopaga]